MIFTDDKGRPIPKPLREEFSSDLDFIRAYHDWKNRVTHVANEAFDQAFRAALT